MDAKKLSAENQEIDSDRCCSGSDRAVSRGVWFRLRCCGPSRKWCAVPLCSCWVGG